MKPERWERVNELFEAAADLEPPLRDAFLDEACAGDESLRKQVESLLASDKRAESFMEAPAYEAAADMIRQGEAASVVGQRISHYRVTGRLGAGGMGEVFLAQDSKLGRKVALKLLPEHYTRDKDKVNRFQQEARAASALNHPNIVTIYEVGEWERTHYISTEYIEGDTLRRRLAAGGMDLSEVLDIAMQVAGALAAAHQAGIIHRDIKPENIMLRPDGYVKVLDFGLAKLVERQAPVIDTEASTIVRVDTDPRVVMGTAHYMSPEQARGLAVDARTDVWSFGAVLYEMVAGKPPFQGATISDVLVSVLEREPQPLSSQREEVPQELQRIVVKALRKDRELRYQTIKDLLADLRSLRQEMEDAAKAKRIEQVHQAGEVVAVTASHGVEVGTVGLPAVQTGEAEAARTLSSAEYLVSEIRRHKKASLIGVALLLMILAAIGLGLNKWLIRGDQVATSLSKAAFEQIRISKLTTSGKAKLAAISPDGKYVTYVTDEAGSQSIWVRQATATSSVQVVQPAEVEVRALRFSPDGSHLYYTTRPLRGGLASLFKVPVLGGVSRKLLSGDLSSFTISPDSERLAFIKRPNDSERVLVIANSDGTAERQLVSHKMPFIYWDISWSPDGRVIACCVEDREGSYLLEVRVDDGSERVIRSQPGESIFYASWLADGSGLLVSGSTPDHPTQQISLISYPDGESRRVTNDLLHYNGASAASDSSAMVTVQQDVISSIWIVPPENPSLAREIPGGKYDGGLGVTWTPDGKLLYTTPFVGGNELWIMDPDGTNRRSLPFKSDFAGWPSVSPDGRYIAFSSFQSGTQRVWRVNIDGGDLKQLSTGNREDQAQFSPDGQWVYYVSNLFGAFTVVKVPVSGGEPVRVTEGTAISPTFSPDGKLLAYHTFSGDLTSRQYKIDITPHEGGPVIRSFNTQQIDDFAGLRWRPNSNLITYVVNRGGVGNIWAQPTDGGPPRQLTGFKSGMIFGFSWSPDGKQLAVARGSIPHDVVLIRGFK